MARGNNVFAKIRPQVLQPRSLEGIKAKDLFLYALFARIALTNNENIEFETNYDEDTETIELQIKDEYLPLFDQITGLKKGPNFQKYINWLIGSDSLAPEVVSTDLNFIGAGELQVWTGATVGTLNNEKLLYWLPSECYSSIGLSKKVGSDPDDGSFELYLNWVFDSGNNTSFDINVNINIVSTSGVSTNITNSVNISTTNLIKGDVRETLIIDGPAGTLQAGDIVSAIITRNYPSSPDLQTELVGILGARLAIGL